MGLNTSKPVATEHDPHTINLHLAGSYEREAGHIGRFIRGFLINPDLHCAVIHNVKLADVYRFHQKLEETVLLNQSYYVVTEICSKGLSTLRLKIRKSPFPTESLPKEHFDLDIVFPPSFSGVRNYIEAFFISAEMRKLTLTNVSVSDFPELFRQYQEVVAGHPVVGHTTKSEASDTFLNYSLIRTYSRSNKN
jgi:hypothetical protein